MQKKEEKRVALCLGIASCPSDKGEVPMVSQKRFMVLIAIALLIGAVGSVVAQGQLTYEAALACVKAHLPAESYSTNQYLPFEELTKPTHGGFTKNHQIRLGFPWVSNDEETQFYIAQELGYFAEEGLEVEFVSGGPGKDHVQSLGGGAVDIAVAAGGESILFARTSPTPIMVTAVGTLLKDAPLAYITLYVNMILDKAGIARDAVTIIDADFTPAVILTGRADFYSGWIMNQPRMLEEETLEHSSYKWNALMFHQWAFSEPSDTIVVLDEMLATAEGRDIVRRFLRATYRGTQYLLDHPEESAEIAVEYSTDVPITYEQALSRFEKQEPLIVGSDELGLLAMSDDQWDNVAAMLVQYGQLKLDCS
ncbi:ABC transporter substrate-binding protein [Candidatus Gottesmanbacteria bacterium]|nr:ABC transporter substrate-binding protein [Candidatus Gottesmanbacteria bacterium]